MTPGISPLSERDRKQMRHMLNLRMNARGRPHSGQRLYFRAENFDGRLTAASWDFLANGASYCRKGIPMALRSARPSASVFAVVTIEMFMPVTLVTRS